MRVGALRLEFLVRGSASLKDKRRAVKSLKERLRSRFNVAASEVEFQDLWQRGALGIAAVGSDGEIVGRILDEALSFVRSDPRVELCRHEIELF